MLTFFRRIRKGLLGDGATSKYLLYAMGEILLVMIGILLALQVNNWNIKRLDSIEEQKVLKNLMLDFEFNQTSINNLLVESKKRINGSQMIIKYCGSNFESSILPHLDSLIFFISSTPQYYPHNGFLDELVGSGKLNLIKNDSLRNLLSSWKPLVDRLKEREDYNVYWNRIIMNIVNKKASWVSIDQNLLGGSNPDMERMSSGFNPDHSDLLNNLEFENLAEHTHWYIKEVRNVQRRVRNHCESIQSLIVNELKN